MGNYFLDKFYPNPHKFKSSYSRALSTEVVFKSHKEQECPLCKDCLCDSNDDAQLRRYTKETSAAHNVIFVDLIHGTLGA